MKRLLIFLLPFVAFMYQSCDSDDSLVDGANERRAATKIVSFDTFDKIVEEGGTVLDRLDSGILLDFKKSLKFTKNGFLATAKQGVVKRVLSKENVSMDEVWDLFRLSVLSTDYEDYWCESRNNCQKRDDWICLSGCSQTSDDKSDELESFK